MEIGAAVLRANWLYGWSPETGSWSKTVTWEVPTHARAELYTIILNSWEYVLLEY
jgi:hypothetical protein